MRIESRTLFGICILALVGTICHAWTAGCIEIDPQKLVERFEIPPFISLRLQPLCSGEEVGKARPGKTYLLIVSREKVAGIDSSGLVTFVDSFCSLGGVPALTGFDFVIDDSCTQLSSPEALYGLAIARRLEHTGGILELVSEINLADMESPELILLDGTLIKLGGDDLITSINHLEEILRQINLLGIEVETIDLRFGNQVVVKPRSLPRIEKKGV